MIKFFRKIRQNLLSEGKTGKYLKYAIGEILLVVIGILIALQINNWNEGKKAIKKTEHLLTQVHKELVFNINEANGVIVNYRNRNSIIYKVLNKKVTYNDYKNDRKYSNVINGVPLAELKDNAFKNLINFEADLTQQQATIISKLIDLYEKNKRSVDTRNELALSRLQKIALKIKDVYPWYYDYHVKKEFTDEMVKYYLNDPIYLNDVTDYSIKNLNGHNGVTLNFRNNALKLYKELSTYLNIKQDSTIIKDLNHYSHYIGIYSDNVNIVEVKKEKDDFIYTRTNTTDSTDFARYILYPDSKTFFTVSRLFGKLTFHNTEVKELILSRGSVRREYKRIN